LRKNGRLAVISFHSLEDRIVKSHFHDVNLDYLNENNQNFDNSTINEKPNAKKKLNTLSSKFRMNSYKTDLDTFNKIVNNNWQPINRKVILPTTQEIEQNPRSRSAKLRVAIKI
jgi:16S rRNA (cytosine1402-N4)-methyltransferase